MPRIEQFLRQDPKDKIPFEDTVNLLEQAVE